MFVYIPRGPAEGSPEGGGGWEIKKRDISCELGAAGATDAVGNANFQEFTPAFWWIQVGARA